MVPFVPVRCPRCLAEKPRTVGTHERRDGKVRYHICQGCGIKFHSIEIDPSELD